MNFKSYKLKLYLFFQAGSCLADDGSLVICSGQLAGIQIYSGMTCEDQNLFPFTKYVCMFVCLFVCYNDFIPALDWHPFESGSMTIPNKTPKVKGTT